MSVTDIINNKDITITYPPEVKSNRFKKPNGIFRYKHGKIDYTKFDQWQKMLEHSTLIQYFWDIESYDNLFCCGMLDANNHLEMFYRVNTEEDANEIKRACEDSGYSFTLYDLTVDTSRFKWHFKKKIPRSAESSLLSDFLGVADVEVKPKKAWYFGYNTLNYDVPMCDHIIKSSLGNRLQTTPASIREYSNTLVNDTARHINVTDYQRYANQVDCAYLNEKMVDKGRPTVGLKTLVGIKGGSIIESKSNKSGHSDNIYKDVLYNINDISELRDVVYPGVMETTFNIRKSLLTRFPKLREHGLTVNSTSAKFVEYIVAPDAPIQDTPTMTFMYPAEHVAKKLGVPQTDVLEDTREWYMEKVFKRISKHNPQAALAHLAKFMSVYSYYDFFRNKNWNDSAQHVMQYGIQPHSKSERNEAFNDFGTYLPFIDEYGKESGTYVNFSVGGIHGAEIHHKQLAQDREKIAYLRKTYGKISMIPSGEVNQSLFNLIKKQSRSQFKDYPLHLSHEISYMYKHTEEVDDIIPPEEFTPYMYLEGQKDGNKEKLIGRYKYTSLGESIHQDFAGYYPMLLINLGAFYDGKGNDPYNDVYQYRLGVKAKLKSLIPGTLDYELVDIEQGGYKLVLNSASGILDGTFDTNLRANNKAMAMRCIGQLFTFRIGMTLALEGASVPSSNTDGIYVFNIDYDTNKRLVDNELKKLYVKIDPEPVFLVSKDSNNRMEMDNGHVVSARGATLTSWAGARVDNRLAHPALVDRVMTHYLQNDDVINGSINRDLITKAVRDYYENPVILDEFKHYDDAAERTFVYMASWVMRSTSGSIMTDDENNIYPGTIRTWLSKNGHYLSKYTTRKIKPSATLEDYASKMFPETKIGNPDVVRYLTDIGAYDEYFDRAITVQEYLDSRKVVDDGKKIKYQGDSIYMISQMKISHLPENTSVLINNDSLLKMSNDDIHKLYRTIDLDAYVDMIAEFAKTWHNPILAS